MIERANGVILRTMTYRETSVIVRWLSEEHGRISTLARGALRPKSAFRAKLDLFYAGSFTFARHQRSSLHTLAEAVLEAPPEALRRDLHRLRQAAYGVSLIEQNSEPETPLPEIYRLFIDFLQTLGATAPRPEIVLAFEIKLLVELGLDPTRRPGGPPGAAVQQLKEIAWSDLPRFTLTADDRRATAQFLHGFLLYHLERQPRNRARALWG